MPAKTAKKSTKKAAKKAPARGLTKKRPKMSEETRVQLARGKKLTIIVKKGSGFNGLVKELNRRLVIDPGIINPRGCFPCHSGIPFEVFGEEMIRR